MKRKNTMERGILLLEKLWLSLLTLCLSLPFACLFEGGTPEALAWAVFAVLPVQAICLLCEKLTKKRRRLLASFAVAVLSFFVATTSLRSFYLAGCCLPILVAGVWLNRPHGKIVLTVPAFYHPVLALVNYALAALANNSLLRGISVGLALAMLAVLLFHRSQTRLKRDIGLGGSTPGAVSSMVRESRKATAAFAILSLAVILGIPGLWSLLLKREPSSRVPGATVPVVTGIPVVTEPMRHQIGTKTPEGKPLFQFMDTVIVAVVILAVAVALYFICRAIIDALRSIGDDEERMPKTDDSELVVEPLELDPKRERRDREESAGYQRKIRRRYRKLILARSRPEDVLPPLTPTELERAARLPEGPSAGTIHALYEKARYSAEPVEREDYKTLKDAIDAL